MRPDLTTGRLIRYLPALTLTAVLTITATAEFELARTVLALPPHIAWALPVAVDSYVLAAMRSGRDIPAALIVMAGALGASMGSHLAAVEHGGKLPPHVVAPAATGIMTVLVVVAWRVHVLIGHGPTASPPPVSTAAYGPVARPVGAPALDPEPQPIEQPKSLPARSEPTEAPEVEAPSRTGKPRGKTPAATLTSRPTDDEQLIAQAAEHFRQAGIYPPSIRSLMRTYGIGQNRASRVHAAITNPAEGPDSQQENALQNSENHQAEKAQQERTDPVPSDESPESTINSKELTHTCITDRVGPAPAAAGMRAVHSDGSHQPQEPPTVRDRAGA